MTDGHLAERRPSRSTKNRSGHRSATSFSIAFDRLPGNVFAQMSEDQPMTPNSGGESAEALKRRRRRGSRGGRGRSRRRIPGAAEGAAAPAAPAETAEAVEVSNQESPMVEPEMDVQDEQSLAPSDAVASEVADAQPEFDEVPFPEAASEPREARPAPVVERRSSGGPQEPRQFERELRAPRPPSPPPSPKQVSAVAEAIEDVYRITEALKKVMEDLDELLETLELAERQKIEDERELDQLRRALRQVQRPREGQAPPPHSQRSQDRPHDRPPR